MPITLTLTPTIITPTSTTNIITILITIFTTLITHTPVISSTAPRSQTSRMRSAGATNVRLSVIS
jgi:hypothetical protein